MIFCFKLICKISLDTVSKANERDVKVSGSLSNSTLRKKRVLNSPAKGKEHKKSKKSYDLISNHSKSTTKSIVKNANPQVQFESSRIKHPKSDESNHSSSSTSESLKISSKSLSNRKKASWTQTAQKFRERILVEFTRIY